MPNKLRRACDNAKHWKTSIGGVATVLVVLVQLCISQFDGDPKTVADWSLLVAPLSAALGAVFYAKDDK